MITQYIALIHSANVLPLNKRIELITNLISIIEELRMDYLCNKGINILQNFDISKFLSNDIKQDIIPQKISSILYAYTEKLYPTLMRLSFEHHGPYIFNKKKYVVKEYFNLKNQYSNMFPVFNYDNVKIIQEIEGDFNVDFFGHSIGDYKIVNSILVVDNEIISDTNKFLEEILINFINLDKLFLEYTVEDYAKNLTNGLFYSLKPLTTLINKDWVPSKNIIAKLNGFKLFFPRDKIINYIKSTDINEIEFKVYLSFKNIFIKD
ncbi:MAG: hypothetical protein PHR26_00955 [Candidatus ainarchaeum sp.]|nr:hypothetical protein [Candidatus ainarchaeum sp.]